MFHDAADSSHKVQRTSIPKKTILIGFADFRDDGDVQL
jgi:hypothetical protein